MLLPRWFHEYLSFSGNQIIALSHTSQLQMLKNLRKTRHSQPAWGLPLQLSDLHTFFRCAEIPVGRGAPFFATAQLCHYNENNFEKAYGRQIF